jgi:adenosylcobyric acid synthase
VPVLGVLPHENPGLPEEDSLALLDPGDAAPRGDDDAPETRTVTVAIPRPPRAPNATDVEPLAREAGLFEELWAFEGPVVGPCGGYQLFGERLTNAALESTGDPGEIPDAGLVPVETRFAPDKIVTAVERDLDGCGSLAGADGPVTGYEVHMGRTRLLGEATRPFEGSGAARDHVFRTSLHGLFENRRAEKAFVDAVYESAGRTRPETGNERESPRDRAAALVSRLDLDALSL